MSAISPPSKRLRKRSSRVGMSFGGRSLHDDLLLEVLQRVERVEELLPGVVLASEELDVVDEQDVDAR